MNQILGLIDALEACILDGKRVPFTHKVIVDEDKTLNVLEKLRLMARAKEETLQSEKHEQNSGTTDFDYLNSEAKGNEDLEIQKALQIVEKAKEKARVMSTESNNYADYILANVQLMITKMQKNLINIESSIDKTRKKIKSTEEPVLAIENQPETKESYVQN